MGRNNLTDKERGAVLVEAALVFPVLISVFLFCTDVFLYTKSNTNIAQVTREAAIFYALLSGPLSEGEQADLYADPDLQMLCSSDPNASNCAAVMSHERVYRLLEGIDSYLDISQLSVTSNYDGDKVYLTVSAPVRTSFIFSNPVISKTAVLKRVGS